MKSISIVLFNNEKCKFFLVIVRRFFIIVSFLLSLISNPVIAQNLISPSFISTYNSVRESILSSTKSQNSSRIQALIEYRDKEISDNNSYEYILSSILIGDLLIKNSEYTIGLRYLNTSSNKKFLRKNRKTPIVGINRNNSYKNYYNEYKSNIDSAYYYMNAELSYAINYLDKYQESYKYLCSAYYEAIRITEHNGDDIQAKKLADRLSTFIKNNYTALALECDKSFIKEVEEYVELVLNKSNSVEIEAFGAVGDGKHDDSDALYKAILSGKKIKLSPGKTYLVNHAMSLSTNNIVINGNGATILFGDQYDINAVKTLDNNAFYFNNCIGVTINSVKFKKTEASPIRAFVLFYGCKQVRISDSEFESIHTKKNGALDFTPLDFYTSNEDVIVDGCLFNENSGGAAGGVWIRQFYKGVTRNVSFVNCHFINAQGDESIAVFNTSVANDKLIEDVLIDNCTFDAYSHASTGAVCAHLVTLGSVKGDGDSNYRNIRLSNSLFNIVDGVKDNVVKNQSTNGEEIVVDNCTFIVPERNSNEITPSNIIYGKVLCKNSRIEVNRTGDSSFISSGGIFDNCTIITKENECFRNNTEVKNSNIRIAYYLSMFHSQFYNCNISTTSTRTALDNFTKSMSNGTTILDSCEIDFNNTRNRIGSSQSGSIIVKNCKFKNLKELEVVGDDKMQSVFEKNVIDGSLRKISPKQFKSAKDNILNGKKLVL